MVKEIKNMGYGEFKHNISNPKIRAQAVKKIM